MANKHIGEVGFEAGERNYKLRFSADAICNLEDALGVGFAEIGAIMQDPARMRMGTVRVMFKVGMADAQPRIAEDEVAEAFRSLKPNDALSLVIDAINLAFDSGGGSEAENPPKPGAPVSGTGSVS